jgi:hypothetical protein
LFSNQASTDPIFGASNIGIGEKALRDNNSGSLNVAVGSLSLINMVNSHGNTAIGHASGKNINGSYNTAIGYLAGFPVDQPNLTNATAIGANAVVSASNSVVLGNNARVGIGTSSPTQKLEVIGNTKTNGFIMTAGAYQGAVFTSDASGNASWRKKILFKVAGFTSGFNVAPDAYRDLNMWSTIEINNVNAFFNFTTGEYYVPESGIYRVYIKLHSYINAPAEPQVNGIEIMVNNGFRTGIYPKSLDNANANTGEFHLQLAEGDRIKVRFVNGASNTTISFVGTIAFSGITPTFQEFFIERID